MLPASRLGFCPVQIQEQTCDHGRPCAIAASMVNKSSVSSARSLQPSRKGHVSGHELVILAVPFKQMLERHRRAGLHIMHLFIQAIHGFPICFVHGSPNVSPRDKWDNRGTPQGFLHFQVLNGHQPLSRLFCFVFPIFCCCTFAAIVPLTMTSLIHHYFQ